MLCGLNELWRKYLAMRLRNGTVGGFHGQKFSPAMLLSFFSAKVSPCPCK